MAWIAWLLAPVAATVLGAIVLWLRGVHEFRSATLRPGNAIAEHRALLLALRPASGAEELPMNTVLLAAPDDRSESIAS
jgi:hypothetical protein